MTETNASKSEDTSRGSVTSSTSSSGSSSSSQSSNSSSSSSRSSDSKSNSKSDSGSSSKSGGKSKKADPRGPVTRIKDGNGDETLVYPGMTLGYASGNENPYDDNQYDSDSVNDFYEKRAKHGVDLPA